MTNLIMTEREVELFNGACKAANNNKTSIWDLKRKETGEVSFTAVHDDPDNKLLTLNDLKTEVGFLRDELGMDNFNSEQYMTFVSCLVLAAHIEGLYNLKLKGQEWGELSDA